ncbi:hypothetical protein C8J56DRAFT_883722 [Mycena floridula]|nr:hypothetical protein C8J56DRAFT_883722 [Mycena floridula]
MACTNCGYSPLEEYVSPLPKHLLESNNPPSTSELDSVDQILSGLNVERDLEALETDILRVEGVLRALNVKKRKMEENLTAGRGILSVIRRIPREIIGEIMLFALGKPGRVEEDGVETTGTSLDVRQGPWVLSQVSQMWRAEILSRPSIWTNIDIYCPETNDDSSYSFNLPYHDIFDCIFDRAKDAPLQMRLRLHCNSKIARGILDYSLQSRATRMIIQDLSIVIVPDLLDIFYSSRWAGKRMSSLKSLRVQQNVSPKQPG